MRVSVIKSGVTKKLSIGLVGPGLIGKTLLRQLEQQHGYLKVRRAIEPIQQVWQLLITPCGRTSLGSASVLSRTLGR